MQNRYKHELDNPKFGSLLKQALQEHKDDEALKLYQKAADAGSVMGLMGAGNIHFNHSHMSRAINKEEHCKQAFHYYSLAASKGCADAKYHLGHMYQYNMVVPESKENLNLAFFNYFCARQDITAARQALNRLHEEYPSLPASVYYQMIDVGSRRYPSINEAFDNLVKNNPAAFVKLCRQYPDGMFHVWERDDRIKIYDRLIDDCKKELVPLKLKLQLIETNILCPMQIINLVISYTEESNIREKISLITKKIKQYEYEKQYELREKSRYASTIKPGEKYLAARDEAKKEITRDSFLWFRPGEPVRDEKDAKSDNPNHQMQELAKVKKDRFPWFNSQQKRVEKPMRESSTRRKPR